MRQPKQRRLITGKLVTIKCQCNSQYGDWIVNSSKQVCISDAAKVHKRCPKCGYWPWVEGSRDIALIKEAQAIADLQ